jgi:maltose O-acetyltransferase
VGDFYDASDLALVAARRKARELTRLYNQTIETESERRIQLLKGLFGTTGIHLFVEPNFRCDYGFNSHVGENFYANF